jgi:peptide deformylase
MALRTIRIDGDELLRKKSREVKEFNDRIKILVQDMIETMYHANGVGLAAPQIGILRRLAVIDVGDGPIVLINPKIISKEGSQIDEEGCLSVPGIQGMVERPMKVKVEAFNENGDKFLLEGEELLARAICHELDHLDGILFTDKTMEI